MCKKDYIHNFKVKIRHRNKTSFLKKVSTEIKEIVEKQAFLIGRLG